MSPNIRADAKALTTCTMSCICRNELDVYAESGMSGEKRMDRAVRF
jgi:hypothetical protein